MRASSTKGFTLIELLVTVAVSAFMLVAAVPSFSELIKNNLLTTATNDLIASLGLARSEAIKQERPVTVCKSDDGASCVNTGNDWAQGWIVYFTDDDGNDVLLRVHEAIPDPVTMNGTSAIQNFISYDSSGWSGQQGDITVCDDRAGNVGKEIALVRTGRSRVGTGAACP